MLADKKALAAAGMQVGKVNSELKNIFKKLEQLWPESGRKKQAVEALVFLPHTIKISIVKKAV